MLYPCKTAQSTFDNTTFAANSHIHKPKQVKERVGWNSTSLSNTKGTPWNFFGMKLVRPSVWEPLKSPHSRHVTLMAVLNNDVDLVSKTGRSVSFSLDQWERNHPVTRILVSREERMMFHNLCVCVHSSYAHHHHFSIGISRVVGCELRFSEAHIFAKSGGHMPQVYC